MEVIRCLVCLQEMVQIVLRSLVGRRELNASQTLAAVPEPPPLSSTDAAVSTDCQVSRAALAAPVAVDALQPSSEVSDLKGRHKHSDTASMVLKLPTRAQPAQQASHGHAGGSEAPKAERPLSWDSCQQIIALAAYPISAWL